MSSMLYVQILKKPIFHSEFIIIYWQLIFLELVYVIFM